MTRAELYEHFDEIRAALARQEMERKKPATFGAWVVRALPHFARHANAVDEAEGRSYGRVLNAWWDWAEDRRLAWRGNIRWVIPTEGPMIFTPPSSEGFSRWLGRVVREAGLEDVIRRSARFGVAPTERTRGGSGRKRERGFTVRKSPLKK